MFAILFFWQLPHSLAIARLYADDYARAGFRLLPVVDREGRSTERQIFANCLALLVVGLLPTLLGMTGQIYFVSSLKLWLSHPNSRADDCDAEVDAVAVVDGEVYLVEAKSSAGLDDSEINQLLLSAERIRPDVLFIACMDAGSPTLDRSAQKLRAALPPDIKLEVLTFDPADLDRSPFLPG